MNWLDRLLAREDINGAIGKKEICPTYLIRWRLLRIGPWVAVYLHHFIDDDWSFDFHDHPKRFISIGLKGSYTEETPLRSGDSAYEVFRAPWIRSFPARHAHRLLLHGTKKSCWTLVIVGPKTREWGFWHTDGLIPARWIPWKEYVDILARDDDFARVVKACQ